MHVWLEKQAHLIDFTLASLGRRKTKNLGLLLAYTLLVFMLASLMLFSHALRKEAVYVLADAPEIALQRLVAGRHDLIPPGYLEKIGHIRGVRKMEGRLWGYYFDPVVKANYTFMARPEAEVPRGSIMVGATLARARGLAESNLISFRSYSGKLFPFKVAAILSPQSELLSADLVLVSEADFRAFFDYPVGSYTDISLSVVNPQEVRTVAAKLANALPDSRPILREEVLRTYGSVFDWREGMGLTILSGAILAFALLAWEKASGLSADEAREIGILKAIGWETGDVIRMKIWESLLISLTAFLLGFVAAWVHVFRFGAPIFAPMLKGWSVLYPHFDLVPSVDGLQVVTLFFFTVVPYMAAVLVPIWRVAITDPDAVMRS
jgi:ABC-type lipoprotein release transport system permease subunit